MSTNSTGKKVLITGGGAKNEFLVQKIREKNKNMCIIVSDNTLIDFKEALLMAYLGFLRITGKTNVISSVTGASKDSIGGALYLN
jgi:anhydro-N-acetylmuramic acid kinase